MIIPAIVLGSILRKPQQKPCEISMFEGDFPTEKSRRTHLFALWLPFGRSAGGHWGAPSVDKVQSMTSI